MKETQTEEQTSVAGSVLLLAIASLMGFVILVPSTSGVGFAQEPRGIAVQLAGVFLLVLFFLAATVGGNPQPVPVQSQRDRNDAVK